MSLPVAQAQGVSSVFVPHGRGKRCAFPITTSTDGGSSNVYVNGIAVVRLGDNVRSHPAPGSCIPHSPPLISASPNVYVNGRRIGRLGDSYACGARIITGSSNVFTN